MRQFIDMHSHILPGIDDGAFDLTESLKMVETAVDDGICDIIVTPHYKYGRHNASEATIREKMRTVEEAAKERNLLISLYPGNEIFYFSDLVNVLDAHGALTLNGSNRVLVEFSPYENYTYIRNALDTLLAAGYVPILAHCERYECMVKQVDNLLEIYQLGVEIQSNASSFYVFNSFRGNTVRRFLKVLLQEQLIDYIGTDAHDSKNRTPKMQKCYRILQKHCEAEYVARIMHDHAQALIDIMG